MSFVRVKEEELQHWFDTLDNPQNPESACFIVAEEIYDILESLKDNKLTTNTNVEIFLTISQVQLDQELYFKIAPYVKAHLRGKKVKVTKKKRTRVIVQLLEDTNVWKKGTLIDAHLDNLTTSPPK